jgi:hypothetical protein
VGLSRIIETHFARRLTDGRGNLVEQLLGVSQIPITRSFVCCASACVTRPADW